jgi:putative DNA methylase
VTTRRQKLIEVGLPLEAINKACKDDKDRKTGHIRNLHKWYAPMPLPAWRAALFASLIDDPKVDGVSDEAAQAARTRIFEYLEAILPLDAAKNDSLFDPVREIIRTRCKRMPTVIDPFCGGGSTLLEAQRLGLRVIGSDLNPIPVLITTVLTRYPSLFSDISSIAPKSSSELNLSHPNEIGLVRDVRHYAELIGQRARSELAPFYPSLTVRTNGTVVRDATVISWIWSRTVTCPNPACGATTPLASSFEITRSVKGSKAYWIEPKVDGVSRKITYTVQTGSGKPSKPPKIGRGAKFECVACHSVIDEKHLQASVQKEPLGFDLMACVAKLRSGGRVYLAPTSEALATVTAPSANWVPDLELSTHPQYMGAPRYGMKIVADLFTARQLKTIEVFARSVRDIRKEIEEDARLRLGDRASIYADAITTILALCVSKLSQSHNVLVRWKLDSRNGSGKPLPAFDTQTVPAIWDFAENNPFGGSVGDWSKTVVPTALRAFEYCAPKAYPAEVLQADARSAFEIGSGPLFIATDPPYYDNVPYADLSDVFYPLLRFMLRHVHPKLFETVRSPRTAELVADYHRLGGSREKARAYFLDGFRDVFKGLKTRADSNVPMIVVYSFKQQEEGDTIPRPLRPVGKSCCAPSSRPAFQSPRLGQFALLYRIDRATSTPMRLRQQS